MSAVAISLFFLSALMLVHSLVPRCRGSRTYLILICYASAMLVYNIFTGPESQFLVLGYALIDVIAVYVIASMGDIDRKMQLGILSMFLLTHTICLLDLIMGADFIHGVYVEMGVFLLIMHCIAAFGGWAIDWLAKRSSADSAVDTGWLLGHLRSMEIRNKRW